MNLNIETITHDDFYEVKVGGEWTYILYLN